MYSMYFVLEKEIKQKRGIDVDRKEELLDFSSGKQDSLRVLSPQEYHIFIQWIRDKYALGSEKSNWQDSRENTMRRKVWSLFCRQMDYNKKDFEQWMLTYSMGKKSLKDYKDYDELVMLVSQAEQVYKTWLQSMAQKTRQL